METWGISTRRSTSKRSARLREGQDEDLCPPWGDEWTRDEHDITDAEKLEAIRQTLEDTGPVIVERWIYYGSSAPERRIVEDYEDFREFLEIGCNAGDSLYVWNYAQVCPHDNALADGKGPQDKGFVPRKGAC